MEKAFVFRCQTYENGMHNGYIIVESLEELAQFIVSNENDKVITDIGDQLIIKTIGSFLDVVPDQQFRLEFMPYLLKAQGYEDNDEEELPLSDDDILDHIFNYHLAIVSSSTEIPDLRMDIDADGRLIIYPYDQEQNILSANLTALDEEEEE